MIKKIKVSFQKIFDKDFVHFANHSKNYIFADVIIKGIAFLSIPIFTRLLDPYDYGVIAIFGSFVSIFTIIGDLGISGSVTRFYYEKNDKFEEFFGSVIGFVIIWSFSISFILYLLRYKLKLFFSIPIDIIIIGISVVFTGVFLKILLAFFMAAKKSKKYAKTKVIKAVLFLLVSLFLTIILKNNKYYGKIAGRLIIEIIFLVYAIIIIYKHSKLKFNLSYIKYSLFFGIPIVFHLLSGYILKSFDKIIINQLIGMKETGLYSFAYKIGMMQNIITMGALKAWTPIFYEKMNKNKNLELEGLAKKYSKFVYFLAVILILFSKEIVYVMADKKYHSSLNVVPIVIISYLFLYLYTMYVNYSFYKKKTFLIAFFTIIAGLTNISLNYLLIPKYGYIAAAWTTLISYFLLFILHYLNVKYFLKIKKIIKLKVFIPNLIKILLIILTYFILNGFFDNYFIILILKILLVLITFFIFFYNKIKRIIKKGI